MDTVLWGISAFLLHRMPPAVRAYVLDRANQGVSARADTLSTRAALRDEIGSPLHLLVTDPNRRHSSAVTRMHVWEGDMPRGAIVDVLPDFDRVRSVAPLLALFGMAPAMSEANLIMALCELCGRFSIYEPSAEVRVWLQGLIDAGSLSKLDGWRPVLTREGKLTSLWCRPPVTSVAEARKFAEAASWRRGHKRFSRAVMRAFDGAASPFEVQAALRLGLPRRMGGSGFPEIRVNERIPLSPAARLIAGKVVCYADLLIEGREGTRPVIVECQSKLIHASREQSLADGERLMALQSMGFTVVPLSFEQLVIPSVFASVERYLARELGLRIAPKSAALQRKESELCRDLFMDWTKLGRS